MKTTLLFIFAAIALCNALPAKEGRIVGGQDVQEGARPYQASLRDKDQKDFCGGAIITKRTVITAAHCIVGRNPSDTSVYVGSNRLSSSGTIYQAQSFTFHSRFNPKTMDNDLAMIGVSRNFEFNTLVQPIELDFEYTEAARNTTLSGWGLTSHPSGTAPNVLQEIQLQTLSVVDCRRRLAEVGIIYDTSLCTLSKAGGACLGDSGSPLVADGKLVGILSWGSPCAKGLPDVYARISSYNSWIDFNKE